MRIVLLILLTCSSLTLAQAVKEYKASSVILNSDIENNNVNTLTIQSPSGLSSSITFTLPSDYGTNGQVLTTDGDGNLSWTSKSNGVSPAGNNGEVQFNDNSSFGASSSFYFDNSNTFLGIGNNSPTFQLHVSGTMSVGNDGTSGAIYFASDNSGGNYIVFQGSATETVIYSLPDNDGEANEALITNGSASLSWGGGIRQGPVSEDTPNNNDVDGNADNAYIGGGDNNEINNSADNSSIYGGQDQQIDQADNASIAGGQNNEIDNNADQSVIFAGDDNSIDNNINDAGIFGGNGNALNNNADYSWIGVGDNNEIAGNGTSCAIVAGSNNTLSNSSSRSLIGAGAGNSIVDPDCAIISGSNGEITNSALNTIIFAGLNNTAERTNTVIGAGDGNTADDDYCVILGGNTNNASSNYVSVLGGRNISLTDDNTIAFGDDVSSSRAYNVLLGRALDSDRDGNFLFSDDNTETLNSPNQTNVWSCLFDNGYYFYTNTALTTGVFLDAGDTAWNSFSDSTKKENILTIDPNEIYNKIDQLKIYTWVYKSQKDKNKRKYGPMAQDFFRLFGKDKFGTFMSSTNFNIHDLSSVFVLGVQGASAINEKNEEKLEELLNKQENQIDRLQSLEERLKSIEMKLNE